MNSPISYVLDIFPEETPVRGNASASDDPALDRKIEDEIIARLDNGDEWAWCTVRVKAIFEDFTGFAYLGGCSYPDEAAFRRDGYFPDLCNEAREDLLSTLRSHLAGMPKVERALQFLSSHPSLNKLPGG
jgi:hypothetical protein